MLGFERVIQLLRECLFEEFNSIFSVAFFIKGFIFSFDILGIFLIIVLII